MLNFKKIIFAVLFLGTSALSLTANAAQINGSLVHAPDVNTSISINGVDFSSFSTITFTNGEGMKVGAVGATGDYSSVLGLETIKPSLFTFDLNDVTSWNFAGATYGTFVANSVIMTVHDVTALAEIFVSGTQTLPGFEPTASGVHYFLYRTGDQPASYTMSGIQTSSPSPLTIPEPAVLALLGIGLIGIAARRQPVRWIHR